jgi:hypothetical protein
LYALEKDGAFKRELRALAHEKAGHLDEAIRIVEELCRPDTDSPVHRATLVRLKRRKMLERFRSHW